MPPFDITSQITFTDVWHRYHWSLALVAIATVLLLIVTLRLIAARKQLIIANSQERKQRQKFQEHQHYLSSIINTEPDCIKILDGHGRITDMNRSGLLMIGVDTLESIQGRLLTEFIAEPDRAVFERIHRQVMDGMPGELEYNIMTVKSELRRVQTRTVPIKFDGETMFLGITRDITREHRLATLRQHLDKDFATLTTQDFFQKVCQHIAEVLQLDHVYVGEVSETGDRALIVGGHALGQTVKPFSYSLAGTPCEQVMGERSCFFGGSVQKLFPQDHWLVENRILSYCGVPIYHQQRGNIGLMIALSTKVRDDGQAISDLLQLAAPRVGAEIERERAHKALMNTEQRFHRMAELSRTFAWDIDAEGLYTYVSHEIVDILGYRPEELIGRKYFYELFPENLREKFKAEAFQIMQQQQTVKDFINPLVNKNGETIWVRSSAFPILDENGQLLIYSGSDTDVTEQKLANDQLRLAASVFTHAHEGIMITDPDGVIVDVNEAFTRITGYPRAEVLGKNPRILQSNRHDTKFYRQLFDQQQKHGYWTGEIWNQHKNGQLYATYATISIVNDNQDRPWRYIDVFFDITHLKKQQQQLERMAWYDLLTNLPNRTLLAQNINQAMAHCQRNQTLMAVVFIDLDGFKQINDQFGHDVGDLMLQSLAQAMQKSMRAGDLLARWGGDEFVALLQDLADQAHCERIVQRLLKAVSMPVLLSGKNHQVSASFGICFYPQTQDIDADQLLRQADQAMYQAKLGGRNDYRFFDLEFEAKIQSQNLKLQEIEHGLSQRQFELFYQPKVAMSTGQLNGFEALLRWRHPERGLLPPLEFLSVIEKQPLDIKLGEWVINQALTQLGAWSEQGLDFPVSINISPFHFQQPAFAERLAFILGQFPEIPSNRLQLEILETHAFSDLDASLDVLKQCQKLGVTLALDDFGTGYCSLNYLKHLPVNVLKIDQHFVRDVLSDPDDLAILEGIIRLAEVFGLDVIAEGVETNEHGMLLLMLGLSNAQGYGIAKPMPATEIPEWVQNWRPN